MQMTSRFKLQAGTTLYQLAIIIFMYPAHTICDFYKISRETVRTWSAEFAEYLSPTANPGKGRQRQFSDSDLAVLSLVAEMKNQGSLFDDIHLALRNGQRGTIPPAALALTETEQPKEIPRSLSLRQEVERLRIELQRVLESGQRKDAQIELLTRQLEAAQREIRDLNREIGRLEADRDTE